MEDTAKATAHYVKLAGGMNCDEFISALRNSFLIAKVGVLADENPSLLSGTISIEPLGDVRKVETERVEPEIFSVKVFELRKKPGSLGADIFVGRAPTNDIILINRSVSKSHARFSPLSNSQNHLLADMVSSNGTFLNGQRINPFEKHPVKDGDKIGLGPDCLLTYYSPRTFYELLRHFRIDKAGVFLFT